MSPMTSGPDDERRQSSEPTFADVMNGFSFDARRSPRRRKWGRRRGADGEHRRAQQDSLAVRRAPAARHLAQHRDPLELAIEVAHALKQLVFVRG